MHHSNLNSAYTGYVDETTAHWHDINFDYVKEMKNLGKDRLVVSAAIVYQNKILLVRRAPDDSHPGIWEFPGGGVDENEKVVDAIRREVLEETNIELPLLPKGEILTHPTRTALRIVVRFDIETKPNVVLSEEHDDFLFADIETIVGENPENQSIFDSIREENLFAAKLVLNTNEELA